MAHIKSRHLSSMKLSSSRLPVTALHYRKCCCTNILNIRTPYHDTKYLQYLQLTIWSTFNWVHDKSKHSCKTQLENKNALLYRVNARALRVAVCLVDAGQVDFLPINRFFNYFQLWQNPNFFGSTIFGYTIYRMRRIYCQGRKDEMDGFP